jgi:hypothetical protein
LACEGMRLIQVEALSVPEAVRVCTRPPLISCGAAYKEAHLYARLQDVVLVDAAWLRLLAGIAASEF